MPSRRSFLTTALATGALGDLSFLSNLSPVSASALKMPKDVVSLEADIEPTVRLIEETPRDRLLEEMARRIQNGLSYNEVLAALQLSGCKNVEPRPSVGHKFHTVLVVNSAHLASQAGPEEERWLPIFWALDYYKAAAARDVRERGDWVMPAVDGERMSQMSQLPKTFTAAMQDWDEAAADAAVAGLARSMDLDEIYEMFFRFGARDFRSIGHKAIFVANSYRTLQVIGEKYAEPILRSLAYALLMHEGGNPSERDAEADRPWRKNQDRVQAVRKDWKNGKQDNKATREFLQVLRSGSWQESCELAAEMLNAGVGPQSIWDAMHVGAGELLMRQSGIVALHAITTSNALYFAFNTSRDEITQLLTLLQNAAFIPMFREAMRSRGHVADRTIEDLGGTSNGNRIPVEEIFSDLGSDPHEATKKTFAYLQNGGNPRELIDAARLLVFLKGNDAHDYKFSSAVLEDFHHVSPEWRNHYLAANMLKMQHSRSRDNELVQRTRAALS